MIGKTFGKLKVLQEGERTKIGVKRWLCQCSCGNRVNVTTYNLTHGLSQSCGCFGREQDLTGRRFGRLRVIERATCKSSGSSNKHSKKKWKCLCDCGTVVVVRANHLKTGNTKSCGCLKKVQEKKNLGRVFNPDREYIKKNAVFCHYRCGARKRKISFDLSQDEFFSLIRQECAYCGRLGLNGVDRVDNSQGYIRGNTVPCCPICNIAKKSMSVQDFISWGIRLGLHLKKSWHPE